MRSDTTAGMTTRGIIISCPCTERTTQGNAQSFVPDIFTKLACNEILVIILACYVDAEQLAQKTKFLQSTSSKLSLIYYQECMNSATEYPQKNLLQRNRLY